MYVGSLHLIQHQRRINNKQDAISQEQLGQIRDYEHVLRTAAIKALGLTTWLGESSEAKNVEQVAYKKFLVPYWQVRIGLYAPVIHADPKRNYSDVSNSLSELPIDLLRISNRDASVSILVCRLFG